MEIILRVDFDGNPYLQLQSNMGYPADRTTAEAEMLEFFIREGLKRGLHMKNEGGSDMRDDYASIRLGRKILPKSGMPLDTPKMPIPSGIEIKTKPYTGTTINLQKTGNDET